MFHNKIIFITGGTGSWGQALTRTLLKQKPKEIRIFSRNEYAQVQMQRAFHESPRLRFIIGDVRDYEAVFTACKDADYVFHLAALKHVPVCESYPEEALKTNVLGTENIIRASINHGVKKVIDVSTDKAVDPVNFYGMTKAFGEKLMLRANDLSSQTRFVCIRGGNVLGTNGSVVPFFKQQILDRQSVSLTSNKMTRFFLSITDAIDLLLKAAKESIGGETFVMKMKACRIADLAEVLAKELTARPITMLNIGVRPGEKLHEVLISRYEAPTTYKYSDQYFVILPTHPSPTLENQYKGLEKFGDDEYSSVMNLMNYDEIKELLEQGGILN